MTDNTEGFPFNDFTTSDDQSLAHVRNVAEWLYLNNTHADDRASLREEAAAMRANLLKDGWRLDDYEEQDRLWRMWFYTNATIQNVFPTLCEHYHESCLPFHSIQALQWSAMVLLLATDPTIPNPDSEVST